MEKISVRKAFKNLDGKHVLAILLWVVISGAAILFIGQMLYRSTETELELRGEQDVIQSAERFNSYLNETKNALMLAENSVDKMLIEGAPTEKILDYLVEETENLSLKLAKSFTGLYGWIRNEYLDGAGWVPDEDFIVKERPWYKTAIAHPQEIVFVDPYVDLHTGNVMMTIAHVLDDGESVIALDIGLEGVQEITDQIALDTPGATVMVLDSGNVAIAHSQHDEIGKQYTEDGSTLGSMIVRELNRNQDDNFTVSYAGQSYRVFMRRIEGGWHSVSVIDTDLFYKPLQRIILVSLVTGILALALVIANFYSLSLREMNTRNLSIRVRAAADIYENLLDISLSDDSFVELNNRKNPDAIGKQHMKAQETLKERVDHWIE